MHETLKLLTDLGLTPINALLVAALWILWKVIQSKDQLQNDEREKAHAATAQLVGKIEKKQEECETDRTKLALDLAKVSLQLNDFQKCPSPACPARVHHLPAQ